MSGYRDCKLFWDPTSLGDVAVNITTYVRCVYPDLADLGLSCDATTTAHVSTQSYKRLPGQYCAGYDSYEVFDNVLEAKCEQLCETNGAALCDAYQFTDEPGNTNFRRCVLYYGCTELSAKAGNSYYTNINCDYENLIDLRLSCKAPAPTTVAVETTTTLPDAIPGPQKPLDGWQGEIGRASCRERV